MGEIRCKNCKGKIIVVGAGNNIGWVHLETHDEQGNSLNCNNAEQE